MKTAIDLLKEAVLVIDGRTNVTLKEAVLSDRIKEFIITMNGGL